VNIGLFDGTGTKLTNGTVQIFYLILNLRPYREREMFILLLLLLLLLLLVLFRSFRRVFLGSVCLNVSLYFADFYITRLATLSLGLDT